VQAPPAPEIKDVKIALVLGGGGARGMAHVGVLEVLAKNNIPVDLVVGTSAGSAIGALYADDPYNVYHLKDRLLKLRKNDILDTSYMDALQGMFSIKGPIKGYAYEKFFQKVLKHKNIEEFKIPYIAVATDIMTNEIVLLRSGPAAPAIRASSAIPPFFTPVKLYGNILVDGGVIAPVPVQVARQFNPKMVITVNISAAPVKGSITNMLYLSYRSLEISYYELANMQAELSDITIHPTLTGYGMFDDQNLAKLYEAGKKAAEKAIPKILQKMNLLKARGEL
jgi:NTE family protein